MAYKKPHLLFYLAMTTVGGTAKASGVFDPGSQIGRTAPAYEADE